MKALGAIGVGVGLLIGGAGWLWALGLMWQSYSFWGALAFVIIPPVAVIYPFYEWIANGIWEPVALLFGGMAVVLVSVAIKGD